MQPDLWLLYEFMFRSRLFEEAIAILWRDGMISGEMHLGTGEEAIIAGTISHLREGDAMALDHRGTAAMLLRGVDPVLILRELLGCPDGLCGGMGGHMHLFSKEHLAASSGIVGSSAPAATGFGLSAQYLHPGAIAVAFFGEGAINQGMLMESLNLAAAWNLPVLFVCKDDRWSITMESGETTGGSVRERARGFGLPLYEADGRDVTAVWEAAGSAIERARTGRGPAFLHAPCVHLEGHFLGFQLLRMVRDPVREMPETTIPLVQSFLRRGGASLGQRAAGLKEILSAMRSTSSDPRQYPANDPVLRTRERLLPEPSRLEELEERIQKEISQSVTDALAGVPAGIPVEAPA